MKVHTLLSVLAFIGIIASCNSNTEKAATQETNSKGLIAEVVLNETNSQKVFYVNATSGLSLRAGTNLKSKKILTLPYGAQITKLSEPAHTEMTIDGISGEMIEVTYQGARGFAFNGYLTTLAPPLTDETLEDYAMRVSTLSRNVEVVKKAHKKGEEYGMTTTIDLPAKNWNEVYKITQSLFNLPKGIRPDFNTTKTTKKIINKDKRERTLVDELYINVAADKNIESVTYSYALKNYSRKITVVKSTTGFNVEEIETSL